MKQLGVVILIGLALAACGEATLPVTRIERPQRTQVVALTTPATLATTALPVSAPSPCILPTPPPTPAPTPTPIADVAMRDFWTETGPEALARHADLIILGTVGGPATAIALPPTAATRMSVNIATDTPVQVECTLKGRASGPTVQVRTEGGCLPDGSCTAVSHGATLRAGQRVVLLLQHGEADYYTSWEDGVYEIAGDEAHSPRHRFALGELLQRIAQRNH